MQYLKAVRSKVGSYHIKSGIFHHNRAEYKQAAEFFRRALKEQELKVNERRTATSYLTQTYIGWAEELLDLGDRESALEKYESALESSPRFADIHARTGHLLLETGRKEDARRAFSRALEINPEFVDARVQIGFLLLGDGRKEEAAQEFERAFLLNMKRIERPFFEGKSMILTGETERGSELIRKAFHRRPYEAEQCFKSGIRSLRQEHWLEAIDSLQRAIDLDRSYADTHNYLGIAFYETGRMDKAVWHFRRSLAINSNFLAPRLNLSYLCLELGDLSGAEEEIRLVLQREPDNAAAIAGLEEIQHRRPAVIKE